MEVEDRRFGARVPVATRVRFRIVRHGPEMKMPEPLEGRLRDIGPHGVALEIHQIVADGLHISYDKHPAQRNRVYLQMDLPGVGAIRAVGETVWYERVSPAESRFVVGLRLVEISQEDRAALSRFLRAEQGNATTSA